MIREFKVEVTEEMARKGVRSVWIRRMGVQLAGCVIFALALAMFIFLHGLKDASPLILLGTVIALVFFMNAQYKRHLQNTLKNHMGLPITYCLDEEKITTKDDAFESSASWDSIKEIWRFEGYWLLFYDRWNYTILPLAGPTADDLQYIRAKTSK